MLKKFASDALGISDIGKVIKPEDFDKTLSDDFVLHEDGETIHFLIKSKTDEYCFTNRALIHLDGEKATSSKRVIKRYDYYQHVVSDVRVETAGTIDLDLEIKFKMGELAFSVDIDKKEGEAITDLYKSLLEISIKQASDKRQFDYAKDSLERSQDLIKHSYTKDTALSSELEKATTFSNYWLNEKYDDFTQKDYKDIFMKYIRN